MILKISFSKATELYKQAAQMSRVLYGSENPRTVQFKKNLEAANEVVAREALQRAESPLLSDKSVQVSARRVPIPLVTQFSQLVSEFRPASKKNQTRPSTAKARKSVEGRFGYEHRREPELKKEIKKLVPNQRVRMFEHEQTKRQLLFSRTHGRPSTAKAKSTGRTGLARGGPHLPSSTGRNLLSIPLNSSTPTSYSISRPLHNRFSLLRPHTPVAQGSQSHSQIPLIKPGPHAASIENLKPLKFKSKFRNEQLPISPAAAVASLLHQKLLMLPQSNLAGSSPKVPSSKSTGRVGRNQLSRAKSALLSQRAYGIMRQKGGTGLTSQSLSKLRPDRREEQSLDYDKLYKEAGQRLKQLFEKNKAV